MAVLFLVLAGILEVVWAYAMKECHGFSRPIPTAIMIGAMIGSFTLLALAMQTLPLGTAYTVWTGIGTVGAFAVGMVVLKEPATIARFVAAALIISGLVIMKFGT